LKDLRQITVVGMGLLGGSITLRVLRSFSKVKAVGHSHRASTRKKARKLCVASEIANDLHKSVSNSDLVILATPIYTFEKIFSDIRDSLKAGCIVTDVGSTKALPHKWARKRLGKKVHYVGSHPITGSEQRGVEFARDDLFDGSTCIVTATDKTNRRAVSAVKKFWAELGCVVKTMKPSEHDRIYADISHVPHVTAASLVNANSGKELELAGMGFVDTTRIASGPANIWADILLANAKNTANGIDKLIVELNKLKKAIKKKDRRQIENLLKRARNKRAGMIKYKMKKKELMT